MAEPVQERRRGEQLRPGTLLGGRYRLEALLGAGGFGVVWRARHVHLETECAVKLFDPPPGADPQDAGARFLQEARLTARLKCRYVAQVFDYGVHEQMPFLVLELLQGRSLRSHLEPLPAGPGRLSPAETARIVRHIAEALGVAHAQNVVHRDLKPENIFLVEDGGNYTAKVLDFGIAKWSSDAAPRLTATHTLLGTAHYMSPEQFKSARHVDHRADLWSLGVIAFECLTGRLPFPGETFIDVAYCVCRKGPLIASRVSAVPAGFDGWFERATARALEQRFASAAELALALESVCNSATQEGEATIGHPAAARRVRAAAPAPRALHQALVGWRGRWIGAGVGICAVALGLLAWAGGGEPRVPEPTNAVDARTEVERLQRGSEPEIEAHPREVDEVRNAESSAAPPQASADEAPPVVRVAELAELPAPPPAPSLPKAPAAGQPRAAEPAVSLELAASSPSGVHLTRCGCKPADLLCAMKCSAREPLASSATPPPATSAAPPENNQGLEANVIRRTIDRYKPAVRQNCWLRALPARAPSVRSLAQVTATVTVEPSGRVQSVTATGAADDYPDLARCIEEQVKDWTFPSSLGETVTRVPFLFLGG